MDIDRGQALCDASELRLGCLKRRVLTVATSVWCEIEDTPKGGKVRHVPLTADLVAALSAHRHLRGPYVLCNEEARRITPSAIQNWIERAHTRAGLRGGRSLHILRHSFCSHLAMRGAPVTTIQALAGHSSLAMTMQYMHLAPNDKVAAIRLLEVGERVENGVRASV